MNNGRLILVGAGPGDPDLITIRGMRALQQADVVLYDRLAHPDLLAYAPSHAERIDVGKAPGKGGTPKQQHINALLVEHARAGRIVVRLKGGDPFVFGRGGEDILAARAAGIAVEIIPGVTSAIAVPEMAFIPVTHRGVAAAFGVFSAHAAADDAAPAPDGAHIDWSIAARMPTTIFLMGVEALPVIAARMIEHGRSADTAVAVIERGATPEQRVIVGTLQNIVAACADVRPPATIVVGEVVQLRDALNSAAVLKA